MRFYCCTPWAFHIIIYFHFRIYLSDFSSKLDPFYELSFDVISTDSRVRRDIVLNEASFSTKGSWMHFKHVARKTAYASLEQTVTIFQMRQEKSCFLHMQKQRRRSSFLMSRFICPSVADCRRTTQAMTYLKIDMNWFDSIIVISMPSSAYAYKERNGVAEWPPFGK